VGGDIAIVEFGCGSAFKTRLLLDAAVVRQTGLHYMPIDISAEFLRDSAVGLLRDYDDLTVTAIAAEYNDGIAHLPEHVGPRLILFLGSNIGNFVRSEAVAFLARVRSAMRTVDRMLVGIDLVKDRAIIEAAYNDAQGVTEIFNKNLLVRVNAELGGEFDLDQFSHHAPYVEPENRIEMRLISRGAQSVRIAGLGREFTFEEGEFIHTENSHKYTLDAFASLSEDAGLGVEEFWHDPRHWFAVVLLRPRGQSRDRA
jgi:dimethylhistidine N-methyltransferase